MPAGFYLKGPGQVAPCPKGEWKAGTGAGASCTKCAVGVSTKSEASTAETDCVVLLPTYYPKTLSGATINETAKCPQKFYCPGGDGPTDTFTPSAPNANANNLVSACADGTWTEATGASAASQCSK